MSLLMEALKKAELAKRKSAETPVSGPAPPPVAAPPSGEGLKLELTPTESREPKREPAYVAAPSASESPVATPAPKFTSMIDRVATETPVETAKSAERPVPPPEPKQEPKPSVAPTPVAAPLAATAPSPVLSTVPSPMRAEPAVAAPRRQFVSRQWIAAGVGALLLLVGGGYAYYQSMSDYMRQQAAMVMPQTDPVPEVVPEPEPPPQPVVTKKPAAKVTVAKPAPEKSAGVPAPAPAPEPRGPVVDVPSDAQAPSPGTDAPVDPPTPIGVARDVDKNDVFVLLQHAYTAYQSGDDARAQASYARVLTYDERNRDALLGLAAIAVRGRDTARALEIYSELLNLDPKDSMAQAGMAGLTGSLDPVGQEARIKNLLDQEPNAPHLLFAYASVLMQQQRWSEAARALQSAQQARNDHPDYAYNLAVSLDHLGQVSGALRFYRRAVELAARHPGVFKVEDAQRRIAALQSAREGVSQ